MYDLAGYYEAESLKQAFSLIKEKGGRPLAGGSDLLIKIREGKIKDPVLVYIGKIPQLWGICLEENGTLSIGACETFSHITRDSLIRRLVPVLGEAVDQVGGPQIRNIGTIGGNVCNGAVSADSVPSLFALNAKLKLESDEGKRIVPIQEFYQGPGKVDLHEAEILTRILIEKKDYEGFCGYYIKYAMREAMDIASLSCCVLSKIEGDILRDIRISYGVAAPVPVRCIKTEEKARGRKIGPELYEILAEGIQEEIQPRDSWRASRTFRMQIGQEIVKRAFEATVKQAGGEHK